jgi:hypothetical protein
MAHLAIEPIGAVCTRTGPRLGAAPGRTRPQDENRDHDRDRHPDRDQRGIHHRGRYRGTRTSFCKLRTLAGTGSPGCV